MTRIRLEAVSRLHPTTLYTSVRSRQTRHIQCSIPRERWSHQMSPPPHGDRGQAERPARPRLRQVPFEWPGVRCFRPRTPPPSHCAEVQSCLKWSRSRASSSNDIQRTPPTRRQHQRQTRTTILMPTFTQQVRNQSWQCSGRSVGSPFRDS
jgi:hypothetical protein